MCAPSCNPSALRRAGKMPQKAALRSEKPADRREQRPLPPFCHPSRSLSRCSKMRATVQEPEVTVVPWFSCMSHPACVPGILMPGQSMFVFPTSWCISAFHGRFQRANCPTLTRQILRKTTWQISRLVGRLGSLIGYRYALVAAHRCLDLNRSPFRECWAVQYSYTLVAVVRTQQQWNRARQAHLVPFSLNPCWYVICRVGAEISRPTCMCDWASDANHAKPTLDKTVTTCADKFTSSQSDAFCISRSAF